MIVNEETVVQICSSKWTVCWLEKLLTYILNLNYNALSEALQRNLYEPGIRVTTETMLKIYAYKTFF